MNERLFAVSPDALQSVMDRLPSWSEFMECGLCGAWWVAESTMGTDLDILECPQCGGKSSHAGWTLNGSSQ